MKRNMMSLYLVFLLLAISNISAQETPPYSMLDPKPYNPEIDLNIDMFIGSWKESMPRHTHGSLVERDILTQGGPANPKTRGAVLKFVNCFVYATLGPLASATPVVLESEQEILYILLGKWSMTAGKQTVELHSGIAVLIPASLKFTMKNTGDKPLSMFLTSEPCPMVSAVIQNCSWSMKTPLPLRAQPPIGLAL